MTAPSLIERLEGAASGSRELDGDLERALFPEKLIMTDSGSVGPHKRQAKWEPISTIPHVSGDVIADCTGTENYTASLDAALALAERVVKAGPKADHDKPEIRITTGDFGANVYIDPDTFRGDVLWFGSARTAPLALCVAIMRARKDTQ